VSEPKPKVVYAKTFRGPAWLSKPVVWLLSRLGARHERRGTGEGVVESWTLKKEFKGDE
jgi:hypothetical protein